MDVGGGMGHGATFKKCRVGLGKKTLRPSVPTEKTKMADKLNQLVIAIELIE